MASIIRPCENTKTQAHREDDHVKREAETEDMLLQAKECYGLLATMSKESRKWQERILLLRAFRGSKGCHLDFKLLPSRIVTGNKHTQLLTFCSEITKSG